MQKQSGVNTVKVVEDVKAKLDQLRAALPPDIATEVIRDQSRFIKKSIEEVKFHLLLAAALVSATILLFIRDWRTTLIATLAIPTSIIPTFLFMKYMGFTLNNITMLGLILAIGIVIDDAVVVHENIFRHMEEDGMDGMAAARTGDPRDRPGGAGDQPLAGRHLRADRVHGRDRRPVLLQLRADRRLRRDDEPVRLVHADADALQPVPQARAESGPGTGTIRRRRSPASSTGSSTGPMAWCSGRRCGTSSSVVLLTFAVIASTVPIGRVMGISLIPRDDQSEYEVTVTTPEGYSLERTGRAAGRAGVPDLEAPRDAARLHDRRPDRGGPRGQGRGGRHPRDDLRADHRPGRAEWATPVRGWWDLPGHVRPLLRTARRSTSSRVQQEARQFLEDYPDLRVSVNDVSPFQGGRRPQTFQVNLAGPDLNQLSEYADQLIAELKKEPGLVDLDTTLSLRKPEVQVVVDREAASDLGVPVGTIADTLRVLVGGLPVSKFREGDQQYDVWLRAESGDRATNQDLYQITFPSPTVGLVKLASLAKLVEDRGPTEIERLGRERIVTVVGNPEGIALGDAIDRAERILKGMKLPPQYSYVFTGQAKTLGETGYYFLIAFGLSITFMYLILAAQFESWLQPIAILMALPVTIPFGMLSLVLFRTPDGPLRDVRPVHAGRDRQEERNPPGRRDQPAPGEGAVAAGGDPRGQSHPAAADPDDDRDAGRGDGPDRAGPGARGRRPGQHGQGDHRRPDALAGPGPAGDARLLRPARHGEEPRAAAGHPLLGRALVPARDTSPR